MSTITEAKWGIKETRHPEGKTAPQLFALVTGLVYIALGVIGFFVTGFEQAVGYSETKLLGLIQLNPFHNVVLIILGLVALVAALALTPPATEGVNFIFAGVLIVVAVLGYLGSLKELMAVPAGINPNTVLYFVLGVVTLLFSNPHKVLTG